METIISKYALYIIYNAMLGIEIETLWLKFEHFHLKCFAYYTQ